MILVKNCKFSFCLFWDKMGLEVVLDDYIVTKLCKKNYVLQIVVIFTIFFTGIKPCFWAKIGSFVLVCFWTK